jgi:tetratricopeptide (TPR) repeat protein
MGIEYSQSFEPGSVARKHMLRMAKELQEEGHVYSAIYLLKRLLEDYPETPESRIAVREYAALGEYLEKQGMVHTALSMYEWLEQLA